MKTKVVILATSSNSKVTELQRRLERAGYYDGAIDGMMGPETRRAIRAYTREHAIEIIGSSAVIG